MVRPEIVPGARWFSPAVVGGSGVRRPWSFCGESALPAVPPACRVGGARPAGDVARGGRSAARRSRTGVRVVCRPTGSGDVPVQASCPRWSGCGRGRIGRGHVPAAGSGLVSAVQCLACGGGLPVVARDGRKFRRWRAGHGLASWAGDRRGETGGCFRRECTPLFAAWGDASRGGVPRTDGMRSAQPCVQPTRLRR